MITKTQSSVLELGTRVTRLEDQFEASKEQMDRLITNVDALNKQVTMVQTSLPGLLNGMVEKTTENVRIMLADCRRIQDAENQTKFLWIPESFKGGLLKLAILGLLTLLGLDSAGVVDLKVNRSTAPAATPTTTQSATSNPNISITVDKK